MAQIRLDSNAFRHNLNTIANALKNGLDFSPNPPKLALVIKDNAYGHGLLQIAKLAKENGIDCAFVKNYDEAMQVRDFFAHITVLYGGVPLGAPSNIYSSIASLEHLKTLEKELQNLAKNLQKNQTQSNAQSNAQSTPLGIELKCNIGMNRNGIAQNELAEALGILSKLIEDKKVRFIGLFAHNGYGDNGGENAQDFFASQKRFYEIKKAVQDFCQMQKIPLPRFHSLSTTGALRSALQTNTSSDFSHDLKLDFSQKNEAGLCDSLVRIGIGAYGYHTAEIPLDIELKPVLSLWASKISTQHLQKGEKIGYGGVSVVSKAGAFSTYDVGYGDGLFRLGLGMPKLHCASGEEILPVMSMDCFSCEGEREEICVFSDAGELASIFGTIPYAILTHLSPFIKRVIV